MTEYKQPRECSLRMIKYFSDSIFYKNVFNDCYSATIYYKEE